MPAFVSLNPEEAFVLRCARVFAGTAEPGSVGSAEGMDAQLIAHLGSEQRISACAPNGGSMEQTRWGLLLCRELLKILELFESNGIEAIPFKGPALASMLYGDPAMRESCDLDILVRPCDIRRTREVLVGAGYSTDLPADLLEREAYMRSRYELHFASPGSAIPIEIHQSFIAKQYCMDLDYEQLWRRAERVPFFGKEILTLSAGDLLLMLAIHGAKHSWAELVHLCDVARLLVIRGDDLRWAEVWEQARKAGVARVTRVGLLLSSRVLCAPVPDAVLEEASQDSHAVELSDKVIESLFKGVSRNAFVEYALLLRSRERFRDRINSMTHLAWSPNEKDYSLLKLPAFLSSLYVPIHAMRVAAKYGRAAWTEVRN